MRKHVFVDLGGPIMCCKAVEEKRQSLSFSAASSSGVLADMMKAAPSICTVREEQFRSAYERAKQRLKQNFSGSEAYNDIHRVAYSIALVLRISDHLPLVERTIQTSRERFYKTLCPSVRSAASDSIKADSLEALRRVLDLGHLSLHVVTDNHSDIFSHCFAEPLQWKFEEYLLPKLEYRTANTPRRQDHSLYISSEGWGVKKDPESWRRIFQDQGISPSDLVFAVDDSPAKLEGLVRYTENVGLRTVFPLCFDPLETELHPLITPVKNMSEAAAIINFAVIDRQR